MVPVQYKPASESPDNECPLVLTTGRVAIHHNAGSMTRRSPSPAEREPDLFIEINPIDTGTLGIKNGEMVEVSSARGETTALARVTDRVKRGVVFMPFHFQGTNVVTTDARDAEARIPEFKVAACKVSRRE
jgi:formate dehydrogenase (coenzyme F420) alpha subunit